VAFARNVGSDFHTIRKTDAGDLADSRVRLTRRLRRHTGADTALEGRVEEGRTIFERIETTTECSGLGFIDALPASLSYKLTDGGHIFRKNGAFQRSGIVLHEADDCKKKGHLRGPLIQ
jgi:hypothetical protein